MITPTSISSATANYNPPGLATASVIRMSTTGANQNLSGIQAPSPARNQIILLFNVGASGNIGLQNNNAGSLAANRFYISGNTNLAPGGGCTLFYDTVTSGWRIASVI